MDASQLRCLHLIDEADVLASRSRLARKEGNVFVISRSRRGSPRARKFVQTKTHLLEALRNTFIESSSKSIRMSALLTFCYHNGFKLVTHSGKPHIRARFVLRTSAFDIKVDSKY